MSIIFSKSPTSISQRAQQTVIDAATATVILSTKLPGWLGTIAVTIYSGAHKSVDLILTTVGYQQASNMSQHKTSIGEEVKRITWQERIWGIKAVPGDEAV